MVQAFHLCVGVIDRRTPSLSSGSMSHPNWAPLAIYSSSLACKLVKSSEGERSSATKSGHRGGKPSRSAVLNRSQRERLTQARWGERFAPSVRQRETRGRVEAYTGAVAFRPLSKHRRQVEAAAGPVSPPVGDMMMRFGAVSCQERVAVCRDLVDREDAWGSARSSSARTSRKDRGYGIIASFFLVSGVKDECLFLVPSVGLRKAAVGVERRAPREPSGVHRRRHGIVIGFGAGEKRWAA